MDDLMYARSTMALSLGFHIVFAAVGMAMPLLVTLSHRHWLKTGDPDAYRLTRAWGRGVAIIFAVGAVSGTVLSFELGLLWPGFMEHAGPIIGMPFSLEGAAFFLEAIFLGLYLYGWKRMKVRTHFWMSVAVGVCGVTSALLVIAANGWMNSPTGFTWNGTSASDIDPWAALMNDAWLIQSGHMIIAAFEAVAFLVLGIHSFLLLRGSKDKMHTLAIKISLAVAAVAAIAQPLHGHFSAQSVAKRQPAKLAAMEAHFVTGPRAPIRIGGIPNEETQEVSFSIDIPGGLSFLAHDDFDAVVIGLDQFPKEEWPPVLIVHLAFQVMVGIGTMLAGLGLLGLLFMRRKTLFSKRWFLWILVMVAPLGMVALEAGWVVTEVGRQPWIIYGILKTKDAVTPVPGQVIHFYMFVLLYGFLAIATAWMWRRQVLAARGIKSPDKAMSEWAGVTYAPDDEP
ncbi:MAG: cytochrome ubiquinol oxidase subunit I [Kofleriaceae bacterium]|nr:cytochrome ubiquinol oxidase subunit I [Kofleriaceae bacterium]